MNPSVELNAWYALGALVFLVLITFLFGYMPQASMKSGIEGFEGAAKENQVKTVAKRMELEPLKAFSTPQQGVIYAVTAPNIPYDDKMTYLIGYDGARYDEGLDPKLKPFKYDGVFSDQKSFRNKTETRRWLI